MDIAGVTFTPSKQCPEESSMIATTETPAPPPKRRRCNAADNNLCQPQSQVSSTPTRIASSSRTPSESGYNPYVVTSTPAHPFDLNNHALRPQYQQAAQQFTPISADHHATQFPLHPTILPAPMIRGAFHNNLRQSAMYKLNCAIQLRLMIDPDTFAPPIQDLLGLICEHPLQAHALIANFPAEEGRNFMAMASRTRRIMSQLYLAQAAGILALVSRAESWVWSGAEAKACQVYCEMCEHDAQVRTLEDLTELQELLLRQDERLMSQTTAGEAGDAANATTVSEKSDASLPRELREPEHLVDQVIDTPMAEPSETTST